MSSQEKIFRQPKTTLSSCCVYFGEDKYDSDSLSQKFVGLKYADDKLKIYFPVGYRNPAKNKNLEEAEKENRKNVLNLIQILRSFGENTENLPLNQNLENEKNVEFPVHAYLFIIQNFLQNGYFSRKESFYTKNGNGKISWGRTVKCIKPLVSEGQSVYLDFIKKKTSYIDEELISQIHKFCVYECFSKLGFLYTNFMPQKTSLKLNKALFVSVIRKAAGETFNENTLLLFKNMIDVLNFLDSNCEKKDFVYGTENFHYIWELLVDEVFGEADKEKFYPKVYWKIKKENGNFESAFNFGNDEKRNSLRPDTIMIQNRGKPGQKIFVLDSKYYRYGVTKIKSHLPSSESIVKQFAYAKYIENKNGSIPKDVKAQINEDSIFNVFIMPADLADEKCKMKNIGFASADFVFWENEDKSEKSWHKIHGILLDTKFLMQNHAKNDKLAAELASLIE